MVEKYLRDKCILIVDDEQEILNMVVSILADGGYENTRTAKNVKEALKCVEEKKPDFAILDVMLPGIWIGSGRLYCKTFFAKRTFV